MSRIKMKVIVCKQFGGIEHLKIESLPIPSPKQSEILIKIIASSVNGTDVLQRKGEPVWIRPILKAFMPSTKIQGMEMAGIVEAIGNKVKRFKVGDKVFGHSMAHLSCLAEYVCLPEKSGIAIIPSNLDFFEAGTFGDGSLTALTFLRDIGKIKKNQDLLIIGASGIVGSFAVQLGKYFGATVTGVCSTEKIAMVKELGADHIIDYKQVDLLNINKKYDLILNTTTSYSFANCKKILKEKSCYLYTPISVTIYLQMLYTSIFSSKKVRAGACKSNPKNISFLVELVKKGYLRNKVDKIFSFEEIAKAHEYVERGYKKGTVAIKIHE